MNVTDIRRRAVEPAAEAPPANALAHCDECGSPVALEQRYCVACGTRRRHVPDPAARYLSSLAGRARAVRAVGADPSRGVQAGVPPTRRGGLTTAAVLALIPVAVGLGVAVGRASNNNDAKLIRALSRQRAQEITAPASPTAATAAPAAAGRHRIPKHVSRHTSSTTGTGRVVATTRYGSVNQIAGVKPTRVQVQQGAQVVRHEQQTQGKSYVNSQRGLPSTVVVP
jgi:hypothetical protein